MLQQHSEKADENTCNLFHDYLARLETGLAIATRESDALPDSRTSSVQPVLYASVTDFLRAWQAQGITIAIEDAHPLHAIASLSVNQALRLPFRSCPRPRLPVASWEFPEATLWCAYGKVTLQQSRTSAELLKGDMTILIEESVDVPTLLEYPAEALHPVLKHLKGWEEVLVTSVSFNMIYTGMFWQDAEEIHAYQSEVSSLSHPFLWKAGSRRRH